MTFPISTAFDRHYSCSACGTTDLDRDSDLNDRTWTCNTCGHPVHILLKNDAGHSHLVERHQASQLQAGDYIIQEHGLSHGAVRILASNEAMGKGKKWYLALEGVGHERVEPDRYYNRIP